MADALRCDGKCPARIRIELICADAECEPVQQLLRAIANSVRWKDRVDLTVRSGDDPPSEGPACSHAVVVCGTHVIRNADYWSLIRALEDCAEMGDE